VAPTLVLPAPPSAGARVGVRIVDDVTERLLVRRSQVQPIETAHDRGAMVTVWLEHGVGYCATADLGAEGLRRAAGIAHDWARLSERHGVFDGIDLHALLDARPAPESVSRIVEPLPARAALVDLLRAESEALHPDPRIVSWVARLQVVRREQRLYVDGALRSGQSLKFV
jgi:predicted Zn-dependent protease